MKRVVFVVNDALDVKATQTTAMMMFHASAQGWAVQVVSADGLSIASEGRLLASGRALQAEGVASQDSIDAALVAMRQRPLLPMWLDEVDVLLLRTNPGREARLWTHAAVLEMARYARDAGVRVVNDPDGLSATASKAYLATLPAWVRPPTVVSSQRDVLVEFVRAAQAPSVLKPVVGTRGNGVFLVGRDDRNLNQILDVLLERGPVVAQGFVPEAEAGDTRVVVLCGTALAHDGKVAAVRRVPAGRDFRSNIHAGGTPAPGQVNEAMERVVDEVGARLMKHGVLLAGFDFIGNVLCEINVFSTGGLHDAERFTGVPFAQMVIDRLLDESVAP